MTSLVQQKPATITSGTPLVITLDANPNAPNTLVLAYGGRPAANAVLTSVVGDATWSLLRAFADANNAAEIWLGRNPAGLASQVTATPTGAASGGGDTGNVSEWTNVSNAAADDTNTGFGSWIAGGGTLTAPSVTVKKLDRAIIICCGRYSGAGAAGAPSNGFTALLGSSSSFVAAYRIVSQVGTYSTSWVVSGGGGGTYGAVSVALSLTGVVINNQGQRPYPYRPGVAR